MCLYIVSVFLLILSGISGCGSQTPQTPQPTLTPCTVPNVKDTPVAAAQTALATAGFNVTTVYTDPDPPDITIIDGDVHWQSHTAGNLGCEEHIKIRVKPIPPTATITPTATALPTITPTPRTNALYPVTLDEWRDEVAQLSMTFTREGNHYWRYVPGGTYTIGGWLDDDDQENDEQADIALPDYWVAKYPITVQQYRQFIDAGGYANQDYWTPSGWEWKVAWSRLQPLYWGDERFMADNQAVVSIYWYEAVTYANWLQSELRDTLPEGTCLRLPTEAEWEVTCAYGADGQRYTYPWGNNEPSSSLADYGRSIETDNPIPVGMHPDGAAPSGVQDIVGGVWEYLSTGYSAYPEASDVVVDDFTSETWNPSTRGAAWYSSSRYVRCGSRDNDPTDDSTNDNDAFFYESIRLVISDCE
jgi:formylglycine-generating enzyme required for sulfatase activity